MRFWTRHRGRGRFADPMGTVQPYIGQQVVYESEPMLYGPMKIRQLLTAPELIMCEVEGVEGLQPFLPAELMSSAKWAAQPA